MRLRAPHEAPMRFAKKHSLVSWGCLIGCWCMLVVVPHWPVLVLPHWLVLVVPHWLMLGRMLGVPCKLCHARCLIA